MSTFETRSRADADGKVTLILPPELANTEIRITVEPVGGSAGSNGVARPTMTTEEWHRLIDRMSGSFPEFPDIERPGPESYESRGDWP